MDNFDEIFAESCDEYEDIIKSYENKIEKNKKSADDNSATFDCF